MRQGNSVRKRHQAWVDAWAARVAGELRPLQRLALFDQVFAALWLRACPTLGELTLSTAAERALRKAKKTFPQLSALTLEPTGVSFRELREDGSATRDPELAEALQHFLVDLLTVLGSLTSEALTPLLHNGLAHCQPAPPASERVREREGV